MTKRMKKVWFPFLLLVTVISWTVLSQIDLLKEKKKNLLFTVEVLRWQENAQDHPVGEDLEKASLKQEWMDAVLVRSILEGEYESVISLIDRLKEEIQIIEGRTP